MAGVSVKFGPRLLVVEILICVPSPKVKQVVRRMNLLNQKLLRGVLFIERCD